jgi:hypothetical protein
MRQLWKTRLPAAAVLLTITLGFTTACAPDKSDNGIASAGGTGAGASGGAPAPGSTDPFEQGRKYAKCMRDHGIDLPDPGSGGAAGRHSMPALDPNSPLVKAATEACQSLDPNAGDAPPPIDPTELAQMRTYAQCMRDHGVDMPDPAAKGGGQNFNGNPDDPVFKAAAEACRDKVPGGVTNTFGPGR